MKRFRVKLIIVLFLLILLAGASVYLFVKYKSIKKQSEIVSPASVDTNQKTDEISSSSQVSPEILKLIGPPEDFDASKATIGTDPEILKLINPPENIKSSTSSNEVSPEILKLIGPPEGSIK